MSNRLKRNIQMDGAAEPSRVEALRLVSEGTLSEVLRTGGKDPASPAHALQERLLQAYFTAPSVSPVADAQLPLAMRTGIITGLTLMLWLMISGAIMAVISFL